MKAIVRTGAALSFLFCFLGGACLLKPAFSSPKEDSFVLAAVGLSFIGMAFFFGSMLWLAAEKYRSMLDKG